MNFGMGWVIRQEGKLFTTYGSSKAQNVNNYDRTHCSSQFGFELLVSK